MKLFPSNHYFYKRFTKFHFLKGYNFQYSKYTFSKFPIFLNGLLIYIIYRNLELYKSLIYPQNKKSFEIKINKSLKFKDIIGIDEYKAELQEIVDYFQNKKLYSDLGANFPKGILLHGKPGTGKTMLAKALSNEVNVKFFYKSGSEFEGKYLGSGSIRIKEMFELARKNSPVIIFIDEIDSIGGRRDNGKMVNYKQSDALNQLLTEMDGFNKNDQIIVVGATNRLDVLDPALLRPGRFDKILEIPVPNLKSREKMIQHYVNKIKIDDKNFKFKTILNRTDGFTGADIKNLINIAALNAIQENRNLVNQIDIDFALDRVLLGNRKNNEQESRLKLKASFNESGNALVAFLLEEKKEIKSLSIKKKVMNSKNNEISEDGNIPVFMKNRMMNKIKILYGCRAAEDVIYGNDDYSLNCNNYMKKAQNLGYNYLRVFPEKGQHVSGLDFGNKSDELKSKYDLMLKELLSKAYISTKNLLLNNKDLLENLALKLFERNQLKKKEILQILESEKTNK